MMSLVAAIFTPVVLACQGWSYRVFRARLVCPPVGDLGNGEPGEPLPTGALGES